MPGYLVPNVDHNLFTPVLPQQNIMEIATLISQKQQLYNTGVQTANRKIQQMSDLEDSLKSPVGKQRVANYNEEALKRLETYKTLDFSIQDNVNLVDNLYEPLLKDNVFLMDYKFSQNVNSNKQKAYSMMNSTKKDEREGFSPTNLEYLMNGEEAVSKAKSPDELYSAVETYGDRTYIPYTNYHDKIQDKINKSGFKVVPSPTIQGQWVIKTENGEAAYQSLQEFVQFNLDDNDINQMRIESKVALERASKISGPTAASKQLLGISRTVLEGDIKSKTNQLNFLDSQIKILDPNIVGNKERILQLEQAKTSVATSKSLLEGQFNEYNNLLKKDDTDPIVQKQLYAFAEDEAVRLIMDPFIQGIVQANANLKSSTTADINPVWKFEQEHQNAIDLENLRTENDKSIEKYKKDLEGKALEGASTPEGLLTGRTQDAPSGSTYDDYEKAVVDNTIDIQSKRDNSIGAFYAIPEFTSAEGTLSDFLKGFHTLKVEEKNRKIKDIATDKNPNTYVKHMWDTKDDINTSLTNLVGSGLEIDDNTTLGEYIGRLSSKFLGVGETIYNQDGAVNSKIYTPENKALFNEYRTNEDEYKQKSQYLNELKTKVLKEKASIPSQTNVTITLPGQSLKEQGSGQNKVVVAFNLKDYITDSGILNYVAISKTVDSHYPNSDEATRKSMKRQIADQLSSEYKNWFNKTVEIKTNDLKLVSKNVILYQNDLSKDKMSGRDFYLQNLSPLETALATSVAMKSNLEGVNDGTTPYIRTPKDVTSDERKHLLDMIRYAGVSNFVHSVAVEGEDIVTIRYAPTTTVRTTAKDNEATDQIKNVLDEYIADLPENEQEDAKLAKKRLLTDGVTIENVGLSKSKFGIDEKIMTLQRASGSYKSPIGFQTKNFQLYVQRIGDVGTAEYPFVATSEKLLPNAPNGIVTLDENGQIDFEKIITPKKITATSLSSQGVDDEYEMLDIQMAHDRNFYNFARTEDAKKIIEQLKVKYPEGIPLTILKATFAQNQKFLDLFKS